MTDRATLLSTTAAGRLPVIEAVPAAPVAEGADPVDPQVNTDTLNYRSRAQALINRRFNAVFGAAMARALATAR